MQLKETARVVKSSEVLVLIVLAFPLLTVAQNGSNNCDRTRSSLSAAQTALKNGDSARAIDQLEHTIAAEPNCGESYLLLGLTEFQRGETENAIQHLQHGLKLAPQSYSGHYDLALAYLKENKLQDARRQLEHAVTLGPTQADAAYDLGIVLLQLQQPAAALPYLRRAHSLQPNRPDGSFNLVRAELESGNVQQARRTAQKEAIHFQSDFKWNAAVGQVFLKNDQPLDAATYLLAAYGLHPESGEVRDQLANAYLACKRPGDVLELVKSPQTAEEHYFHGSALFSLHRFPEAEEDSRVAFVEAPQDAKIVALRVRLLQRAGEQDAALELAQRAATLAPNWDVPFYLAGISNYFLRHYTDARQSLARAFELNPRSGAAIFLEGLAWANEGNAQEAEMALRRAVSLEPENGRFQCHLGIMLMRTDREVEAERRFKRAIELKPGYALPYYQLAKLQQHSNRFGEAAENYEKSVALDPGFTSAYYQLSRVYGRLGEKDKAEQMLALFASRRQQEDDESAAADADAHQQSDAE